MLKPSACHAATCHGSVMTTATHHDLSLPQPGPYCAFVSHYKQIKEATAIPGARRGTRTPTVARQDLNLVRLPIPPFAHFLYYTRSYLQFKETFINVRLKVPRNSLKLQNLSNSNGFELPNRHF